MTAGSSRAPKGGREKDDSTPPPATDEKQRREGGTAAREIGGPKGPEPTRYGDWEKGGRCTDF